MATSLTGTIAKALTKTVVRTGPLALLLVLVGCPRGDAPSASAANADAGLLDASGDAATATSDGDASSADGSTRTELAVQLPWTEAIRGQLWKEAEAGIEALSPGEQNKPEVRFARARVSLALGKHADAVSRLEKLEDELPLLRDAIGKARAQAAFVAGPFDRAAEWYGTRPTPPSWITAAEAWEKAGDLGKARTLADRAIAVDKNALRDTRRGETRAFEERARTLRMRVVRNKDGDAAAAADARWLAVNALDDVTVTAANEVLEKQAHPAPLTGEELLARSRVLADVGRSDEALRAVERAGNSGGKGASAIDVCHARAEAYYKARSRYPEAALAYRTCAAMGGPKAAEDSFLSARAFSRADRDGDALPAFAAVIQRFPRTTWADQAEFHVARAHALAGRWSDATRALDDYVKHFPNGHEKKEAERYRAVAHLMAHDDKIARKLLEDLAGGEGGDSLAQARWQNLAALAALRDGDRTHAIARWTDVARGKPLSWPALVARGRLTAAGAPLPLTIDPPETGAAPEPLPVDLPPPVDVLHRIGLDADAEEALRERESVVAANAQGRGTEALCAAYAQLDRGKRRYQVSLQIPPSMLTSAPGPRNRWAWDCAYPRPHKGSIHTYEASAKLPSELLWSVMRQESAFDEEVVSPARAVGLLQLMPDTARTVATAAGIPHEEAWLVRADHNVQLGALYMRDLLAKLNGNVPLAVGSYNAGLEAITRWQSHARGESIDVFVETIPFLETRGYVVRVMGNLARYGYMEHGEQGVPQVPLDAK